MVAKHILLAITNKNLSARLKKSVLNPAGYTVTLVEDPSTFEIQVKTIKPDLILLSEIYKERNGLELAEDLIKSHPTLPIILLVSKYNVALLQKALRIGISDCLEHPVHSADVLWAVENSLNRCIMIQELNMLNNRGNTKSLRKQTERGRNRYETIVTMIEDGVIVVGPDNRLIMINLAARKIFDLGEADLFDFPLRDVFKHPDLLEIFDEHKIHPSRSEIIMDDGRVFTANKTIIPDVGSAVIMQDITYLKELDRLKTDFVNTVSHDLRSPLTAILGYVELIDRVGKTNIQQREFIHRIQYSVNNITALINDLLDLGRVEAGFDTRNEIVQLPSLIRSTIEELRVRISEREQDVTVDIPANLPSTLGNPLRLRQMISNLVINSIKYTPRQGKLTVQARAEGGQIIIQVIDNGPGIPLADQPYIFDKFYRGSNITDDIPGTGLGLSIVKTIVENHRGRIWLNSIPNQGTTFTIVLPTSDNRF